MQVIDKPFADRFALCLQKQGYMPNTINKNVSCFRKLCNLAAMEGYNKNAAIVPSDASRISEQLKAAWQLGQDGIP